MKPCHALVVEDHEFVRDDIMDRLESMGHSCDCVETQEEAQECLNENSYSYILLDLQIPFSYNRPTDIRNGINLLYKIHENNQELPVPVPVIVMTSHGHDSPDLAVEVLSEHKAVHFVKKPLALPHSRDSLEEKIRSTLKLTQEKTSKTKPELSENIFRRKGRIWQLRFKGKNEFNVLPTKGAEYIHRLLASPDKKFVMADIFNAAAINYCDSFMSEEEAENSGLNISGSGFPDGTAEIIDEKALKQYRKEVSEIDIDIKEARNSNNTAMVERLEMEKEGIMKRINEAIIPGGRLKKLKDKTKNFRDAFRNNVNRVINEIKKTDKELAEHLKASINFGNTPSYKPDIPVTWETTHIINN